MNDAPKPSSELTINRIKIEYSAYYAAQEPAVAAAEPPSLLIGAHGYGQSCKSFMRDWTPLRDHNYVMIAPQGPNQFYWQQSPPKIGFTWMTSYMRLNTIEDLMGYMARLMDELPRQFTYNPRRVFSLGFSQGSALAFRFGASDITRPAGIIACGGDLPPDVAERLDDVPKVPVLIVHGTNDPAMSYEKAREGEQILRDHGWSVDTQYFEGGHDLPEEQVRAIIAWMDRQPDAKGSGA